MANTYQRFQRHLVTTEGDTAESNPRERAWILDDITEQSNKGGKGKKERREESHKALCPRN